jgi:ribose 5-phosphate isomerase A
MPCFRAMDVLAARERAARAAAALVEDGMVVGLGSGRTAGLAVRALGERAAAGLRIGCVATSGSTEALARGVGLRVLAPSAGPIDLTIDGADQVDPALRLIKGGGGALTREKIVARASRRLIIVVDREKLVPRLHGGVPVELVAFGASFTLAALAAAGLRARLREDAQGRPVASDNGGLLAEVSLPEAADLATIAAQLDGMSGVVEHGLFLREVERVLVGGDAGVDLLVRETP